MASAQKPEGHFCLSAYRSSSRLRFLLFRDTSPLGDPTGYTSRLWLKGFSLFLLPRYTASWVRIDFNQMERAVSHNICGFALVLHSVRQHVYVSGSQFHRTLMGMGLWFLFSGFHSNKQRLPAGKRFRVPRLSQAPYSLYKALFMG